MMRRCTPKSNMFVMLQGCTSEAHQMAAAGARAGQQECSAFERSEGCAAWQTPGLIKAMLEDYYLVIPLLRDIVVISLMRLFQPRPYHTDTTLMST